MADNMTNPFDEFDEKEEENQKSNPFDEFDVKKEPEVPKSKIKQKFSEFEKDVFLPAQEKAKEVITGAAGKATGTVLGTIGDVYTKIAPQSLQYKTAIEYDATGSPIVKDGRIIPEVSIFEESTVKDYFDNSEKEKQLNKVLRGYVTASGTPIYWDDEQKKEFPTAREFLKDADQYSPRTLLFAEPFEAYDLDFSNVIDQYTKLAKEKQGFQVDRLAYSDYKQEPFTLGSMIPGTERFGGALVQDTVNYVRDTMGVKDTQTLAVIAKLTESGEIAARRTVSGIYTTAKFLTADAAVFIARTAQSAINYNETRNFVPFSTDVERKIFNDRWLAGSAADLRKRLLVGGVSPMFATQEFAEKLLAFSPTVADRGFKVFLDVKGVTAALGLKMASSANKEFIEFTNFVKSRPRKFKMDANGRMTKGTYDEAINEYKKQRIQRADTLMGRFLDNLQTDRLVRGFEINLSKLPLEKRQIVIENRKVLRELIQERDRLTNLQKVNTYNKRYGVEGKLPEGYDKSLVDINRAIHNQRIATTLAEKTSGTPKYIRELQSADSGFVLFGTSLGQLNQNLNGDPLFGEFAGYTYAMMDLFSRGTRFEKFVSFPVLGVKSLARATENLSLKTLELYTGKGTFLDPSVAAKGNEDIIELANTVRTLSPQAQEYVEERVAGFKVVIDDLVAQGVPADALKPTLAKLSGLAAVEAFEMAVRSEMYASRTFDTDVIAQLQDATNTKKEIVKELKELSLRFTDDIGDPEIQTVVTTFKKNLRESLENVNKDIAEADKLYKEYEKLQLDILVDEYVSDVKGPRAAEIIKKISAITDGQPLPLSALPDVMTKSKKLGIIQQANSEAIRNQTKDLITKTQSAIKLNTKLDFTENDQVTRAIVERILESQREIMSTNSRRGYIALDNDPKLGNAKTDGTNLFNTLFDDVTSSVGKAKIFNEKAMKESDSSGLIKLFDVAAKRILTSKLTDDEIRELRAAMKADGYERFSPAFMVHYNNEIQKSLGNPILPLKLGFEESIQVKSALTRIQNRYAYQAQNGNTAASGRASAYAKYLEASQKLFKNFKSDKGVSMAGLDKKLKQADAIYKAEYADRYFDNNLAKSLIYTRKLGFRNPNKDDDFIAQPTTDHPEAKVFVKGQEPITRFNMDALSSNPTSDATKNAVADLNADIRRMFGKTNDKGQNVISAEDNPDLVALGKHLTTDWILRELTRINNAGKVEDVTVSSPEFMAKLESIQRAFATGDGKYLFSVDEFFDADGPFSLLAARKNKKEIDSIASDTEVLLKNALDKNKANKEHLKRIEDIGKNQALIFNAKQRWNTSADIYEDLVVMRDTDISEFKKAFLANNKGVTPKQADEALRYIIANYINEQVFQVSKELELFPADQFGQLAKQVQDVDFEKLRNLITADERGIALKEILGEDHYNALLSISRYMELTKIRQDQIQVMGIPRSLSVESWISRIYSINRGVVSPKYVATEAALQQARKKNISTLEAIIADPDAAELFAKIILEQRPLEEKLGKRLLGAIAFQFSYASSRVGWRDYIVEGKDLQLGKAKFVADKIIPDAIQPEFLTPTNEMDKQMQQLQFVKNKNPKKLWGKGTPFNNYEAWKKAQPEYRTSIYMQNQQYTN